MGRITTALFFEVILLALSIQTGESIRCYICDSNQSKCADPIDRSGVEPVECTNSFLNDAASAVKKGLDALGNVLGMPDIPHGSNLKAACQKIDISDQSGNKHTIRGCSATKNEAFNPCAITDSIFKRVGGAGKLEFCETCETDLCNGASQHSFTIISAFVVPCFAIIISRWIGV